MKISDKGKELIRKFVTSIDTLSDASKSGLKSRVDRAGILYLGAHGDLARYIADLEAKARAWEGWYKINCNAAEYDSEARPSDYINQGGKDEV
jgi:hypothetical protein